MSRLDMNTCQTSIKTDILFSAEGFNDWGGRGYDDFIRGEVTKTAPSGVETT